MGSQQSKEQLIEKRNEFKRLRFNLYRAFELSDGFFIRVNPMNNERINKREMMEWAYLTGILLETDEELYNFCLEYLEIPGVDKEEALGKLNRLWNREFHSEKRIDMEKSTKENLDNIRFPYRDVYRDNQIYTNLELSLKGRALR